MTLSQEFLTLFEDGQEIPVNDVDLPGMERILVTNYLGIYEDKTPEHQALCESNWENRRSLLEAIRGANSSGELVNRALVQRLDNPLEQLLNSRKTHHLGPNPELYASHVLGIRLSAEITASRGKATTRIDRSVWLIRTLHSSDDYKNGHLWRREIGPNTRSAN